MSLAGSPPEDYEPNSYQLYGWAAAVALIVAACFGAWFYLWPKLADYPDFPSAANGACKQFWVSHAQNDEALHCYLTFQPSRFCDPIEKQSLVALVSFYRAHAEQFQADLQTAYNAPRWQTLTRPGEFLAALKEATDIVGTDGTFSSPAHPTAENPGSDQEQPKTDAMEALDKHFAEDAKRLMPPTLPAAFKVKHIPYQTLVEALRNLHHQGYINIEDFGWSPDSLATDALAYEPDVNSSCIKPN
jgi:hypothetical protein